MYSVICSSKFSKANYGKKLRGFITENYDINLFEDYSSETIFEGATTYPCIIKISKNKTDDNVIHVDRKYNMKQSRLSSEAWVFKPELVLKIKDKIKSKSYKLLGELNNISIYRGITTGYNSAFVIDENIKNQLIEQDNKNKEIIEPLLRGRDIKKWDIQYSDLYIIVTKNGVNVKKEYPTIYKYLLEFGDKLKKRQDQGDHWSNLRNCVYYDEFHKNKLLYPSMTKDLFTVYDEEGYYLINSAYMIITNKSKEYTKALSILLSSKVLDFYMKLLADVLRGKTLSVKKIYVEQLPIGEIDEKTINELSEMVDSIMTLKKQYNTSNTPNERKLLQKQIDLTDKKINDLVYELYDLTPEEIEIIESSL